MPVFHEREITAEKPGPAFNVTLRQAPLAAVGLDHFTDINFGFFFWHCWLSCNWGVSYESPSGRRKRILATMFLTGTSRFKRKWIEERQETAPARSRVFRRACWHRVLDRRD